MIGYRSQILVWLHCWTRHALISCNGSRLRNDVRRYRKNQMSALVSWLYALHRQHVTSRGLISFGLVDQDLVDWMCVGEPKQWRMFRRMDILFWVRNECF